ncbi:hypothetical protein WAF17_04140 [Bernardetia sp. ABR2-2B]|uniref:hypothetical protein n=1 Tax=Bernardetia sp. ABR2-2B TaxID=3127472 RepID=UPI0030D3E853
MIGYKVLKFSYLLLFLLLCSCTYKGFPSVYRLQNFDEYEEKRVLIGIDSNSLTLGGKYYYPIFINRYNNKYPWGYVRSTKDTVFFMSQKGSSEQTLFVNNINSIHKENLIIDDYFSIAPEPFSTKMNFTLTSKTYDEKLDSVYTYSVKYLIAPVSDYIYLECIKFSPVKGLVSVTFLNPFGGKSEIRVR